MMHISSRLIGALLVLLVAGGCGDGLYQVEGKVVWKDGTPATELKDAQVVFELAEKSTSARAVVEADGTFKLSALAGEHKVLLIENRKYAGGEGSVLTAPKVDERYATPNTSGLTATVKSGTNPITLTVDRAPKK